AKVTSWAQTPEQPIARTPRALAAVRIRGVATNLPFLANQLRHPALLANECTTKFIHASPGPSKVKKRRDRATKILIYIADITVNGHPETAGRPKPPAEARTPRPPRPVAAPGQGARDLLVAQGPRALADWMGAQKRLLVTDTTMR